MITFCMLSSWLKALFFLISLIVMFRNSSNAFWIDFICASMACVLACWAAAWSNFDGAVVAGEFVTVNALTIVFWRLSMLFVSVLMMLCSFWLIVVTMKLC